MKRFGWMFFLLFAVSVCGQASDRSAEWEKEILNNESFAGAEYKNEIVKYDFAPLWTQTDNSAVLGFIGENYQRMRIKIISAVKDKNKPDTYAVSGKSMVKNNLNSFTGTIRIEKARILKKGSWGVDDDYQNQGIKNVGVILARYNFAEDKRQPGSGVFEGRLATYWYIDKNDRLQYDDVEAGADAFSNNPFVGIWKSYKTGVVKIARWGDYRIPLSGELDIGAGEFAPEKKYWQYGWQNYIDAYSRDNKRARREEERQWWK